jgi:hypothetical protein
MKTTFLGSLVLAAAIGGCGTGSGGAASASASAAAKSNTVYKCVTEVGCFHYTGKAFIGDKKAAEKSCATADNGKIEEGMCPKAGMVGACTRNPGANNEYQFFVPEVPGSERSLLQFAAKRHCQESGDIGVWEDIAGSAPAASGTADASGAPSTAPK